APASTPGRPANAPAAPAAAPDRSAAATVHMGAFGAPFTMTNVSSIGCDVGGDLQPVVHTALSIVDHDSNIIPMLAERLPSIDDGSWVVNGDGSMRLTWQLRRNVKWHDGAPFTSRDVRFSWEFNGDASLPITRTA